jgi:hypothetical protein
MARRRPAKVAARRANCVMGRTIARSTMSPHSQKGTTKRGSRNMARPTATIKSLAPAPSFRWLALAFAWFGVRAPPAPTSSPAPPAEYRPRRTPTSTPAASSAENGGPAPSRRPLPKASWRRGPLAGGLARALDAGARASEAHLYIFSVFGPGARRWRSSAPAARLHRRSSLARAGRLGAKRRRLTDRIRSFILERFASSRGASAWRSR